MRQNISLLYVDSNNKNMQATYLYVLSNFGIKPNQMMCIRYCYVTFLQYCKQHITSVTRKTQGWLQNQRVDIKFCLKCEQINLSTGNLFN